MDKETPRRFESVYSSKVRAGRRRTYFFDVRKTKGDDYYITLTESTKKFNGDGYERHKIFLYKEDFNRFLESLEEVINHIKTELMPDYDYDEFTKKQAEWEEKRRMEKAANQNEDDDDDEGSEKSDDASSENEDMTDESDAGDEDTEQTESSDAKLENDDDMSW